jgi:hypothetical protein
MPARRAGSDTGVENGNSQLSEPTKEAGFIERIAECAPAFTSETYLGVLSLSDRREERNR